MSVTFPYNERCGILPWREFPVAGNASTLLGVNKVNDALSRLAQLNVNADKLVFQDQEHCGTDHPKVHFS